MWAATARKEVARRAGPVFPGIAIAGKTPRDWNAQDGGAGDVQDDGGVAAGSVDLPGGASGVGFDDIRLSTDVRRVVSAPGSTGNVDLVDPDALAIVAVPDSTEASSA